ncbi:MAG TPA: IPT/TIG domain-containing protein, partial [Vicinamibacterales bacterium]|nr:IPT/TIG domain-containing protein [Vicinamibacterales bacterium]
MPALASPFGLGTRLAAAVLAAGIWLAPAPAAAQTRTILASLPNFIGPVDTDPPFPALTIGTFTYAPLLPGETIEAAQVRGTWGNSSRPESSAGVDLFVDRIQVAQCVINTLCWFDAPPDLVPWSFNFTPAQFPQLADGQAVMTGQMTSRIQVYLGTLRLELTVNTPPILTVSGSGTGSGTITSQAGLTPAINCTITVGVAAGSCQQTYPLGTVVTLTATGTAGSSFDGWSGSCTSTPCGVTMSQAQFSSAAFTAPGPQTLTLSGAGTGTGTVTSQAGLVPAINCTITAGVTSGACSQSYPWGTSVTLTGSGTGGSTLSGWSGACAGSGTCPVSMTQARNVTAAFIAPPQTLTVTGGGAGSGTVTSQSVSPAINCTITHGVASGTCSQSYPLGTPVTLAASPTGGATFSGWSGACTAAAGTCSVTMSQPRSVIAGFGIGALTLSSLTPARGSTAGGTAVDVIGQAFVAGATTVSVGGVPAAHVAVRSPTRLSFVTPAGPAGSASIVVSTPNATGARPFTFVAPDRRRLTGARRPSFSFDGRYMAFESRAPLVADDTNGAVDVYVFDHVTDTVRRVSVSSAGTQALGGESQQAAISATGRFVAFQSRATNLVPSDGNDLLDVFVHDRDVDNDGVFDEPGAIRTVRVSVGTGGVEALHGFSRNPSISGNGRWVAFETAADNLVAGDTNGRLDICVHDRLLGRTVRVDVSTLDQQALNGDSLRPAISLDGRYVAFDSAATNLAADGNGRRDVFVRDRDVDGDGVMDEPGFVATERVSVSPAEAEAAGGDSTRASITQDGRFVAFDSAATNLVADDTNGERDVFLRDRLTGDTRRLSVAPGGGNLPGPSRDARISANGAR